MKLRNLTALAGVLVATSAGLLGWGYWASRRVPDFYEAALEIGPAVQQSANDELLETATALASEARKEGSWQALFTAEQINGWLAVDLARNYPDLLPKGLKEPRVNIRPDRVTMAGRYVDGAVETVMSLDVEVYMTGPNVLSLRLHNARAGAIPVPLGQILNGLARAAADAELELRWLQTEGDPVAVVSFLPPRDTDHIVYQLETLELREGEIYVAGRTTRGGSADSPVWEPGFKPVAIAPELSSKSRQR
ncbi:MAG: hypothetical protein WD278_06025 [Pirellulales bacterium]